MQLKNLMACVMGLFVMAGCEAGYSLPSPQGGAVAEPVMHASPEGASEMEAAAARSSQMVGRSAPPFALPNQDEETRSLESFRGQWVVLYFYPKDDTPGCTCQATEFTNLLQEFNDLNARVVGVSADPPYDHRFFRAKYELQFTLLSDVTKKVMRQYGAWVDTPDLAPGSGRVIRSTFLIDPQGRVAHHWPEVIPQGHAMRVKQVLAEKFGG